MTKRKVWRPKVTEEDREYRLAVLEKLKVYLRWWSSVNSAVDAYNDNVKKPKDYLSKDTVYYWLKDKEIKAVVDWWRTALEQSALSNIAEAITIDKDLWMSTWYLERRSPDFKNKKEITINNLDEDPKIAEEAKDKLKELWLW